MKKKIILTLLALVCALCCAFVLAACSGGKTKKLKVSAVQFEDDGIDQITLYTANADVMEKDEEDENKNDNIYGYFNWQGNCYDGESGFSPVELKEGTYGGVVCIRIKESHYVQGSWMNGNLAIKLKINGKECELMPTKIMGTSLPFSGDYWTLVGEDGVFSEDLSIEVIGKTIMKTYKPTVTINNYDANKNDEKCQGLKFKAGVTQRSRETGEFLDYEPVEYNSKTAFTAPELKEALDSKTFTYYDYVKVTAYFENKDKFFPSRGYVYAFMDGARVTDNLEIEWEMEYSFTEGQKITLDFAVFEENGEKGGMTLDDMTKISFKRGSTGGMFETMFQAENVKFVVDGTEKDELTLADYCKANSVKVKSIVSDLGATVLQDQSMYVITTTDWHAFNEGSEEVEKRLTQSEIIIGNAVVGKPGYKEVTLDFGNYKPFKGREGNYTAIELNVYNPVPITGGYTFDYYSSATLESLQKVEFENKTTGGFTSEDGYYYEYKWDGLSSAGYAENQIADWYYDEDKHEGFDAGCYYAGDEVALVLGFINIAGDTIVNNLELTISREGEADQVVKLTGAYYKWYLDGTYEGITCEVVETPSYTATYLTIKSSNVTKVSGKLTITEVNHN